MPRTYLQPNDALTRKKCVKSWVPSKIELFCGHRDALDRKYLQFFALKDWKKAVFCISNVTVQNKGMHVIYLIQDDQKVSVHLTITLQIITCTETF